MSSRRCVGSPPPPAAERSFPVAGATTGDRSVAPLGQQFTVVVPPDAYASRKNHGRTIPYWVMPVELAL